MLTRLEGDFCNAGYTWVMNQDLARRDALRATMLKQYERLKRMTHCGRRKAGACFDGICSIRHLCER